MKLLRRPTAALRGRAGLAALAGPIALLLASLFVLPVAAQDAAPAFDPARADWYRAELEAHKLFKSMSVTIGVLQPDPADAATRLIEDEARTLLPPGPRITALSYRTEGLGRRNDIELLVDPDNGQILQRVSSESGKRLKYRVYRFGSAGALRRTSRPGAGEEHEGPAVWSDRSEQWFPVPPGVSAEPLTEAGTLVYLIAISGLQAPGERFEINAFSSSDETVYRIEAEVLSPERVDYDYRLQRADADGTETKGETEAIRVAIHGRPLEGQPDGELTLFGMKDVELMLDPATRAPLELRGRVDFFGGIRFELRRLGRGG
jgi:hypothetical protein